MSNNFIKGSRIIVFDGLRYPFHALDVFACFVTGQGVIYLLSQKVDQLSYFPEVLSNLSVGRIFQSQHANRVIFSLVQKPVSCVQ